MDDSDDDEVQSMMPSDNEGGMDDEKEPTCTEKYEGDKFIWDQEELNTEALIR